jgi:putative proteasome-type protease
VTFAVGIRVAGGLVGLADTRVVRGHQTSSKGKLSVLEHGGGHAFVMTSGLRSIRDKTFVRVEDELATRTVPFTRMHELVTRYGDQLKRVRAEDDAALAAGGLSFDSHAIIGGQLEGDATPELFLVYPEGNWVMATADAPTFIIGRSVYGKPLVDRLLRFDLPLAQAIAVAYLAFDATRTSAVDVDYPFDMIVIDTPDRRPTVERFDEFDLAGAEQHWHARLNEALHDFPTDWIRAGEPRPRASR